MVPQPAPSSKKQLPHRPAVITALGAGRDSMLSLEIQDGEAKPVVKINKESGVWAFNCVKETNPKTLAKKVDLLKSEF
jgi:hypothetical protein